MLPAQRNTDNIQNLSNKRELVTRGPDPGQKIICLIGWLKKRGGVRKVSQCNEKLKQEGINIEDEIERIGTDFIRIYRTSGGEKVVRLENMPWADQWLLHYGMEVPHHSQFEKTKSKFLETERKI
jgi:hypothetical protein